MAAAQASDEPVTAEKPAAAPTEATASPPGIQDSQLRATWNSPSVSRE